MNAQYRYALIGTAATPLISSPPLCWFLRPVPPSWYRASRNTLNGLIVLTGWILRPTPRGAAPFPDGIDGAAVRRPADPRAPVPPQAASMSTAVSAPIAALSRVMAIPLSGRTHHVPHARPEQGPIGPSGCHRGNSRLSSSANIQRGARELARRPPGNLVKPPRCQSQPGDTGTIGLEPSSQRPTLRKEAPAVPRSPGRS